MSVGLWPRYLIQFKRMRQVATNKVIASSITGRADVIAAIARLAEEVARLELRFKLDVAIGAAAKAERAAEALQAIAGRMTESGKPKIMSGAQPDDSAPVPDTQLYGKAEAAATGTSIQPGGIVETPQTETLPAAHCFEGYNNLVKIDEPPSEPKNTTVRTKDAIATRVLALQDRLGGFLKA